MGTWGLGVWLNEKNQIQPALQNGWVVINGNEMLLTDAGRALVDPEHLKTGWIQVGGGWRLP